MAHLLERARANNARLNVTGHLLYDEGSFLQVLEGDEQVLAQLYEVTGRDKRHHRLVSLLRREVPDRYFAQWSMEFSAISAQVKRLPGYSD